MELVDKKTLEPQISQIFLFVIYYGTKAIKDVAIHCPPLAGGRGVE